ncbi:RNA dependent RNA polymerase-domain-containing protein [Fusarium oxysporum Fo47]|uniref:RNA dependent RNA polymerase-domain-containing protein n=1 Tax=Fusarium oxysporum Fo47 TaxID=660027 RepID=UPI002869A20D|nr:RNA dependent RNA polymerase-domain-containing protein [Fusarium oxysporum Fo47]QKD62102.2 RNA dependent RNA polymerase-domain-containing protein [Fusarium oxysporum Fo47]
MSPSTIEPGRGLDVLDELPIRMYRQNAGPVAGNSAGRHSVYLPTTEVTNTNRQYDCLVLRSELDFQTKETKSPNRSEPRIMISQVPICDDRHWKKPLCHDDDSDDSDYSVSSSLADVMSQVWNENENLQQLPHESRVGFEGRLSQLPCKNLDAVTIQLKQGKEHNVAPHPALAGNLSTIWPSCPVEMDHAPLIIKWELHRVARHCSVVLENASIQYSPLWEDQSVFRDALKGIPCFQGKTFPEACDTEVWLRGLADSSHSGEVVVFKAVLRLDPKTGDARLDFELPALEKSCRLSRKFAPDRFIDLKLRIGNRAKAEADNLDLALARWLVRSRHPFLSRKWAAFFIDEFKSKNAKVTPASEFAEERQVILFAEQGQGIESSTMLNWLLQTDQNLDQPYMKLFHRISQGILSPGSVLVDLKWNFVLEKKQLRNYLMDEESPTGNVMNDGIGRVSLALMRKVQHALGLDYLPSAIQGRIGSAKGIWVLDIGTQPSRIWIETYKSQEKWNCDWEDPQHRTLEILTRSAGLEIAQLNHQFISILESQSVNRQLTRTAIVKHMKNHLQMSLDSAKEAMKHPELFRKWIHETSYPSYGGKAESWFVGGLPKGWPEQMSFLSDGGFNPLQLGFLHNLVLNHMESQLKETKNKMKIKINQSTWALIIVDFQRVLGPDEVQLCFSSPFNDGLEDRYDLEGFDVLVARCPAHLPSDIQKVKAVFKPELRHLKDVIVFPCTGQEPLADKLSGGDYDGDKAWICWDKDIVNNFRNAEVPTKPSFDGYFEPNKRTVKSLISMHGQSNFLDHLLEEAFTFHLAPKFVGICTNYKERLAYHKDSLDVSSVLNMSWLLSTLVDQTKSGFMFNDKIWRRFQKEYCENQVFLKRPAYKNDSIGSISGPCHILDFLKFTMQELIQQGLTDLHRYRSDQNGNGGPLVLSTFDKDLISYWNEFEAGAKNLICEQDPASNWLLELRSNLERDIHQCASCWVEMMSGPDGRDHYLDKAASVYERWDSISPQITTRSASVGFGIWVLTRPFTHSPLLETWQLLKASLTFKLYHKKPKFVWQIAGRQLQFIKSTRTKAPIPVISRTYKVLRPDGKRIAQHCVSEDGVLAENISIPD